ncbi:hypothetical protein, partial [Burkholderia vietnamiensis]|uniref:hypothetical protein n=1 Tax=Burkholderia vietnamiensis TaxID=60552 RepID=UPI00352F41B2
MDLKSGKRVSAKEAAAILGVPYQNISRIDRTCTIIQRFRLGHKTYVYDLDSLYRYLAACQSKPSPRMVRISDERDRPFRDRDRRFRQRDRSFR